MGNNLSLVDKDLTSLFLAASVLRMVEHRRSSLDSRDKEAGELLERWEQRIICHYTVHQSRRNRMEELCHQGLFLELDVKEYQGGFLIRSHNDIL